MIREKKKGPLSFCLTIIFHKAAHFSFQFSFSVYCSGDFRGKLFYIRRFAYQYRIGSRFGLINDVF